MRDESRTFRAPIVPDITYVASCAAYIERITDARADRKHFAPNTPRCRLQLICTKSV